MRRPTTSSLVLVAAALTLLLAGCGVDETPVPRPEQVEQPRGEPAQPPACGNQRQSYAPGGSLDSLRPAALRQLTDGRRLVVGVSADTHLLAARDPFTGELAGFDIDMVRIVARALWPGERNVDDNITYRVITAAERIPFVAEDTGDLVVRNMTATCDRWVEVAFSAIYFESGQKLLVRSDLSRRVTSPSELRGHHTVCVPAGTTSQANIEKEAPQANVVTADRTTGCLVRFQRGEADAITSDDTVLAGLAAQDPYAVIPRQQAFSEEPYGIAVNADNRDLVRFVNAALEQAARDGSWQRAYDRWLRPTLGDDRPPRPEYGR